MSGPSGATPLEHSPAPTPLRAVYGFVSYLLASAALAAYLAWLLGGNPMELVWPNFHLKGHMHEVPIFHVYGTLFGPLSLLYV